MNNSQNKNKLFVIIPFYNEHNTISEIINSVIKFADRIILVNDGSTDSWEKQIPDSKNISLISFPENRGKGSALNSGFRMSIELKSDFTLTLDADLQHNPSYIPNFIEKIKDNDIVVGFRNRSGSTMPIHRRLSNFLTSKMLAYKTGMDIKDSQCGFRIYKTGILESILPETSGFEAESEILVKAARQKLKIGWVTGTNYLWKRKEQNEIF